MGVLDKNIINVPNELSDVSSKDKIVVSILKAADRILLITYADFGTPNQRITNLVYSSPSIAGVEAHKTLSYTLVGTRYRRDSIIWSIVNV